MPKKVGFLAFLGSNYGTALQSFALYNSIKRLGYDCEVIGADEFLDREIPDPNVMDIHSKEYDKKQTCVTFSHFNRRYFKYSEELGKIPASAALTPSQKKAVRGFDAFVCGSDQIWKPATFWFCAKRYLQFAPEEKRIGYAPSVGWNKIPASAVANIPQWRTWLSSVKYLSTRETTGSAIVSVLTGRPVATVVDPTLLLTPEDWDALLPSGTGQLSQEIKGQLATEKPYLLAYLLDTYGKYKKYVEGLAKRLALQVIWLTGRDTSGPLQRNCSTTDPVGFLQLLRGASFVCIDGFHGTCFSINYGKPFALLTGGWGGGSNDSRKQDLMERVGVYGRAVSPGDSPDEIAVTFDYVSVRPKIDAERQKSLAYLSDSLKGACASTAAEMFFNKVRRKLSHMCSPKPESKPAARAVNRVPLDNSDDCTGCGSCANTCPVNAITMKPNENGFLHPSVNDAKCVHCGKCLNNCPMRKRPELPVRSKLTKAYALWAKKPEVVYKSASGGAFALFASKTLVAGGVAYGVAWDENLRAHTVCAANPEELSPICGSKYVQADPEFSYRDVKKKLEAGKPVLFSGTSCQVAGLYSYLGKDYENLLTLDLLCGGVPSPMVLKSYLNWRERALGSKVVHLEFRSKKLNGWGLGMVLGCENGKVYRFRMQDDEYGILYNQHFVQRPSCFSCRFRGIENRISDISIGDFWGIGKQGFDFKHDRKQGVSVMLPNSEKGKAAFNSLVSDTANVFVEERPLEEVYPGNAWLTKNYGKRAGYEELYRLLRDKPFEKAFNEYFGDESIRLSLKL